MTAARIRLVARVGGRPSTLPPFLVLSIALHVAFVAAMLFLPSLRPKRAFPIEPSIQAVLMPAPGPRQPAAPAVTPEPEPEVEAPTQEVTAAEEMPPAPIPDPNPPPVPKPRKVEPKPEPKKPKPAPPRPAPAGPAGPASGSRPAAGNDGPIGNPDGADALAGMGSEFNWYRDAVARALYSAWQQPMLNSGDPVEVAVAFDITRNGRVRNVRIERGSDDALVDRSVLRAVQEATLPPLPRNHGGDAQPALFVFRLHPE